LELVATINQRLQKMNSHIQNISSLDIHNDDLDDEIINIDFEIDRNYSHFFTSVDQPFEE
jgi:hypothetical protein